MVVENKKLELNIENVKKAILSLGDILQECEAVGIFGSLARGRTKPHSDIDIFVVVKDEQFINKVTPDVWRKRIDSVLLDFHRDSTVLVYTVKSLKNICTWYVLRLASEGILIFDKGNIKELFKKIVEVAKKKGLVEMEGSEGRKFWFAKDLKFGEVLELKVEEND